MIKINLLPVEKRKAERTPLPRFGLILTNVAVLCILLVVIAFSWFQVASKEQEIEGQQKEFDRLAPEVQRYVDLTGINAQLTGEYQNLKKVTDQRPFAWWTVFDAVWEVVQNNPKVWLDSIDVLEGKQVESKVKAYDPAFAGPAGFGVILKCHTGGQDVKNLTKFRRDLKVQGLLARLCSSVNYHTEWTVGDQKDFQEQYSLDFEVVLVGKGAPPPPPPPPPPGVTP